MLEQKTGWSGDKTKLKHGCPCKQKTSNCPLVVFNPGEWKKSGVNNLSTADKTKASKLATCKWKLPWIVTFIQISFICHEQWCQKTCLRKFVLTWLLHDTCGAFCWVEMKDCIVSLQGQGYVLCFMVFIKKTSRETVRISLLYAFCGTQAWSPLVPPEDIKMSYKYKVQVCCHNHKLLLQYTNQHTVHIHFPMQRQIL